MKEWRSDIYGRSLSEKGRKKMMKAGFRNEDIKTKGAKNAFNSALRNIKRPVLWIALFAVGIMFTMLDAAEKRLDIPRLSAVSGEVSGTVCDIEFKNQKTYLYLKNIEFKSDDLRDFKNIKSSSFLCRKMGMVCILKEVSPGEVLSDLDVQYKKQLRDSDKYSNADENKLFYIGSKITIHGKINVYNKATNPGEFDMRRYYISKGYLFNASSCEVIASDSEDYFDLADINAFFIAFCKQTLNYDSNIPDQHAYMYYTLYNCVFTDINKGNEKVVSDEFLNNINDVIRNLRERNGRFWSTK